MSNNKGTVIPSIGDLNEHKPRNFFVNYSETES